MKTTLEIDDELYRQAKSAAALSGRRLKDMVSDGLRLVLNKPAASKPGFNVLGCLKKELKGRTVEEWMDEIRGPVEPSVKRKAKP